jgi:hypothetical protein
MPGYGISEYGIGEYGEASPTGLAGAVQWIFLVDWDGDGSFAYNEGAYMIDLETRRGQRYLVQERGAGFETFRPGDGTATLTNKDGRFDPDNASGPLYEKILPGRKFRLSVKDLATDIVYPIMAGFINDIPPLSEYDRIQLALRESWSLLDQKISIPILYRNSITDVIKYLLDEAEWPNTFGRAIDTETQQVTAFAADKVNALDVLINLGAACLGQIFADNEGRLIFYARGQASMPTVAIDQAQVDKMIRRSQPWENLRNIIHVTANKKVKAREAPVWQNSGVIQVNGSSSNTITVQYQTAIDVRVYQFVANSAVNGTGVNMTSSVSYTLNVLPASLEITFTNASATTAYVTKMIILGRPIVDQPITKTVVNALSQTTYGKMNFDMDNPYLQDLAHATAYATMISNFLDEPERTIEVMIDQRPELQYSFDLMDKIDFTSAKLGIDATYYVGLIEHRWEIDNGQKVKTKLVMRPRLTDGTAISNDPEDPDLPYIPEAPYDPGIPIPNDPGLPPVPGGTCLTDMAATANGPFVLSGPWPVELRSNGEYYFDQAINDGIWMRTSSAANPTFVTVTGDWQIYDPNESKWIGETSSTNWRFYLNGIQGTPRTITDAGSGTRALDFTGGVQMLTNMRFEIDPTAGSGEGVDPTLYVDYYGQYSFTHDGNEGNGWTTNDYTVTIADPDEYRGFVVEFVGTNPQATKGLGCPRSSDFVNINSSFWESGAGVFCSSADYTTISAEFSDPHDMGQPLAAPSGTNLKVTYGWSSPYGDTITFNLYIIKFGVPAIGHRWYIRGVALYNVCSK